MTTTYLAATTILNYQHPTIQDLVEQKKWRQLTKEQAVKAAYYFIRDEIKFGYNRDDTIPASEVLSDGYGQCNTKSSLFMALLRALHIPCRFHGFTIYNALQRGAIPDYLMLLAPKRILHSWVEVELNGKWLNQEGFIIDKDFLEKIQNAFPSNEHFSGYGIDVPDLQKPENEFNGESTYIQSGGIADDFGVFNAPDEFYAQYGSNLHGLKKFLYSYGLRHLINRNVKRVRQNGLKV
mgnify:CR=1 FL=1